MNNGHLVATYTTEKNKTRQSRMSTSIGTCLYINIYTQTPTHTHTCIYIYIYLCI